MKNTLFLITALTLGLAASLLLPAEQALADDCLLDRDNDGVVDAVIDNDGSANSNNDDTSTACGTFATATGRFATAIGSSSSATADRTIAIGRIASATAADASAVGHNAEATASLSLAVGQRALATAPGAVALGQGANAGGIGSSAIGYRAFAPIDGTMVLGQIPGVNQGADYIQIANGTTDPLASLHIFRDDGTAQLLVEETSLDPVPRTLFRLAGAGSNTKFEIDNTVAGESWAFTNSGNDFRISRQGSGVIEFLVDNDGNAFIAGDLDVGGNVITNLLLPSDVNIKQNIAPIDPQTVLTKVAALPVSTWEYKDRPGQQHLGPMAQDFHAAFGLGPDDSSISAVDASGVALAAIKALESRNRALEGRIEQLESLERENADLRERLALVETLVAQLLPQTTQN